MTTGTQDLQAALEAEYAAVFAWGLIGAQTTEDRRALARAALARHEAARTWLRQQYVDAGQTAPAAAAAYDTGRVTDPGAAAALAMRVELACVPAWSGRGQRRRRAAGPMPPHRHRRMPSGRWHGGRVERFSRRLGCRAASQRQPRPRPAPKRPWSSRRRRRRRIRPRPPGPRPPCPTWGHRPDRRRRIGGGEESGEFQQVRAGCRTVPVVDAHHPGTLGTQPESESESDSEPGRCAKGTTAMERGHSPSSSRRRCTELGPMIRTSHPSMRSESGCLFTSNPRDRDHQPGRRLIAAASTTNSSIRAAMTP